MYGYEERQAILSNQFFEACENHDFEKAKFLLEEGADVRFENDYFIEEAVRLEDEKIFKFLVENGANIFTRSNACLKTACKSGSLKMLKLLIDSGLDIKRKSLENSENSILYVTCLYKNFEIVNFLIEMGVDISVNKEKILMFVAKKDTMEIFQYLVTEQGQDADFILKNDKIDKDVKDWYVNYKELEKLNKSLNMSLNNNGKTKTKIKI